MPGSSTFGERLRKVLADRKLSQRELAKRIFVTQPTVSGWLRGAIPYERNLDLLCDELRVSRDWLVDDQGEPYPHDVAAKNRREAANALVEKHGAKLMKGRPTSTLPPSIIFKDYMDELRRLSDIFGNLVDEYARITADIGKRGVRYRNALRQLNASFGKRVRDFAHLHNSPKRSRKRRSRKSAP